MRLLPNCCEYFRAGSGLMRIRERKLEVAIKLQPTIPGKRCIEASKSLSTSCFRNEQFASLAFMKEQKAGAWRTAFSVAALCNELSKQAAFGVI